MSVPVLYSKNEGFVAWWLRDLLCSTGIFGIEDFEECEECCQDQESDTARV